ncbi:D-Ala-D-Ala carboxypeptidase family metallohydrolase [Mesorhizobium sp. L-8-3]|uniref:D-Ala-D-Ala carboxypeptidase family metallohydrolase n=1 Tax=Mesorhizobium sp. L-8-3 TaxID=2744522 RepID=UPI001FD42429|nr:D-Ala-D-Ala carboxypeptidase family metallohydrolase [Mesorhizobium sp. L-8-3]
MTSPSYAPGVAGVMEQAAAEASAAENTTAATQTGTEGDQSAAPAATTTSPTLASASAETALPQQVAYLPTSNPLAKFPDIPAAAASSGQEPAASPAADAQPEAKSAAPGEAGQGATAAAIPAPKPSPSKAPDTPAAESGVYVTAIDPKPDAPIEPKKRGFLSSLFGTAPAAAAAPTNAAEPTTAKAPSPARKPTPIIELASTERPKPVKASLAAGSDNNDSGGDYALPGVRQTDLFEIKRKSGLDDDSDVDLHEDEDIGPIRVASAAGLARLAPNGLMTQTDRVDVSCLKPSLVRVLKTVEQHYGRKIVVTSGYRSPAHNRRARGAKNSLHMYCAAADVQVQGVSKWELAKFVRSMPGRGGVGTYCHTESVHIDVGPERDWNWRCRRRRS